MKFSHGISNFLEISSLSHSIVFPYFLHWSLRRTFLTFLAVLWNSALRWVYLSFLLCLSFSFSQLFERPPQTTILPFCISFPWGWSWSLPPVQCHKPLSSSSDILSDLIPWICLSHLLYNHKGFDLGHTWMASGFPYFLQCKSEFGNKEFMIWATVGSRSCFCWLYRDSPSLAAKNIINLILVLTT